MIQPADELQISIAPSGQIPSPARPCANAERVQFAVAPFLAFGNHRHRIRRSRRRLGEEVVSAFIARIFRDRRVPLDRKPAPPRFGQEQKLRRPARRGGHDSAAGT